MDQLLNQTASYFLSSLASVLLRQEGESGIEHTEERSEGPNEDGSNEQSSYGEDHVDHDVRYQRSVLRAANRVL